MNLAYRFKEAKENKIFIVKRSYFKETISWEKTLGYIYDQSSVEDTKDLNKKYFTQIFPDQNRINTVKGNISVHAPLWIKSLSGKVWEYIPELKNFLYDLNNDFSNSEDFEHCSYYSGTYSRVCDCKSIWHTEGMVVSLASRLVSEHRDVFDAGYIQLIGRSFWKIEGEEEICVLDPGDMLLLPNELTHEVWGEGPRMGILLYKSEKNI